MVTIFIVVAVFLVVFGGLLAAADSALGVLSRQDLLDEADDDPRHSTALTAIAADVGAHVNAVNFVRILAETSAAVLVSL